MITREQLQGFAAANGVPLFTQERDYVQALFLSRLYEIEPPLVFKGGTCLRLIGNLPRFSDDLDFTATRGLAEIRAPLTKAAEELGRVGMWARVNKERHTADGFKCRLRYRGPLYTGEERTAGSIALEISLRKDVVLKPEWRTISPVYPDAPPFTALCMQIQEILAEKIRALLVRAAPRDLYDIWFLLSKGVKPRLSLIDQKLGLYKKKFHMDVFKTSVERARKNWARDLAPLLSSVPRFDAVAKEAVSRLQE